MQSGKGRTFSRDPIDLTDGMGRGPRIGRLRCGSTIRTHIPATTAPFGLWSPHHTRIRHRLTLPHEMRRELPLQFFFQVFTWEKNTNGSSSGASLSLSLHLQPEACPILFLEPTDPCYDDDDASSQPRDQTIGGSSPPFCHVPSLSFLFFSFPYAQLARLSLDFE